MSATRDEHLALSKRRALEYLDHGDISNAVTSMLSDLGKHPELAAAGEKLTALGMLAIMQHDELGARRFIEGFR